MITYAEKGFTPKISFGKAIKELVLRVKKHTFVFLIIIVKYKYICKCEMNFFLAEKQKYCSYDLWKSYKGGDSPL